MQHAIVAVAVFLVLGIMAGFKLPFDPGTLLATAAATWTLSLVAYRLRRDGAAHVLLLALVSLLGALRCQMTDPVRRPDSVLLLTNGGRFDLELVVVGPVRERRGTYSFEASVASARSGGREVLEPYGLVAVSVEGRPADGPPTTGSRLRAAALLRELPHHFTSPWADGRDQQYAQGIVARASVPYYEVKVLPGAGQFSLRGALAGARERALLLLDRTHEERTAGVLKALLVGDKSSLPPAVWDDFRRAGTVHLLAVSGLHVGLLAMVVYVPLAALRLGRASATAVTLLVLGAYCLVCGETPSVVRAALMTTFLMVGRLLQQRPSYFASLAASALLILGFQPGSLAQPGLQLSYLATLGILYLSPVLADLLAGLPAGLAAVAAVSLAAWLATAPIMLWYFDGLALAAPLANLVVLPLVGILMPCALLTVVGGLASAWLAYVLGAANYALAGLLVLVNSVFASPLFPLVSVDELPYPAVLAWYLALVVAGDPRALRSLASRWRGPRLEPSPVPPAAGVPDAELFGAFAEAPAEGDLLTSVMAECRVEVRRALPALRGAAPEARRRLAGLLGAAWPKLHPAAAERLLFAEGWSLAGPSDEQRPALAALFAALEAELEHRVIGPLREAAGAFPTEPRGRELAELVARPRAPLPLQLDVLWTLATPGGPHLEPLLLSLRGMIDRCMPDGRLLLDATRLPLQLDQLLRRHYWKLPVPGYASAATFLAVREAVAGTSGGLLAQVHRCEGLNVDEAGRTKTVPALAQAG